MAAMKIGDPIWCEGRLIGRIVKVEPADDGLSVIATVMPDLPWNSIDDYSIVE